MLTPIRQIEYILSNPCEQMLEEIKVECHAVIKDQSIEENEKVAIIKRTYKSVCERLGESDSINTHFGDLYKILSDVTTETYSDKCLKKSDKLFRKVVAKNDIDITRELENVHIRLGKITISENSVVQQNKKKSIEIRKKNIPRIKLDNLNIGSVVEQPSNTENELFTEFNKLLQILERQTLRFKKINKTEHNVEEVIFFHQNRETIIKMIHNIRDVFQKKTSRRTVLKAIGPATNLLPLMKDIEAKINLIDTSQEKIDLSSKINDLIRHLNFLTNISQEHLNNLPEECPNDEEILQTLNACIKMYGLFTNIITKKNIKECTENGYLTTAIEAWANFFQFTEKNYLLLDEKSKNQLFKIILELEKNFEKLIEVYPPIKISLLTYISLLVQKQCFIHNYDEQQENLRKIKIHCYNYSTIYKENVGNAKRLHEILKHSSSEKIKSNFLSPRKSPVNENKKKAESIIKKIIENNLTKNKDISVMLNKKEEKYSKCKKINKKELSPLMKNIGKTFREISKADLSNHNLTKIDLLKISYIVEKSFFFKSFDGYKNQDKLIQNQNLVFMQKNEFLTRDLLINISEKKFTLMSKLQGDLKKEIPTWEGNKIIYITGGIKKVSSAASFFLQENTFVCKETILATPKKTQIFDKKCIDYLFKFQGKRGLIGCDSYMEYYKITNTKQKLKQLILQDRATGDLFDFISTHNFKEKTTWEMLFLILEDIAHGINHMHSCGDIHWDIKLLNILFYKPKNNPNHQCTGMINDFDTTFNIKNGEQSPWLHPIYGSVNYKAPEIARKTVNLKDITEDEAKRRDMFALGCMFIDILDYPNPSKSTLYEKINEKTVSEQEINNYIKLIKQSPSHTHNQKEFLKLMAYNLVHPNLKKRWTSEKLKKAITSFQFHVPR